MKYFFSLAAVAIASVSAQSSTSASTPTPSMVVQIPPGGDKDCLANYIVKQCLQTESDKLAACATTDYACICYASQAIATCYNNCPNDTRAPQATASMNAACATASIHVSSTTKATKTAAAATTSSDAPNPTDVFTSVTFSAGSPTKTNAADSLAGNAAGMLAAFAGVVAAAL
ncbi:hypothetical protein QQS21_001586 [Conoideocrella luteorostrata]|uniref:GPI anchored serine-threonine rich protein n=1 Tax=Conoideocrella luteorostrata TaxID=1105319 RepID=A0AAJ0D0D2_9HYPO|nr:hypothetical protein QQS21_001586 [Conoideocrella luteorostrata]